MKHGNGATRQAISQHLAVLQDAGIVITTREGRHKFHRVDATRSAVRHRRAGADRWLTVVAPDDPAGPELLLEPSSHPAVQPYKEALVADGTPATSFAVADVISEHERLQALGVKFT